jgi:hypothetical protein
MGHTAAAPTTNHRVPTTLVLAVVVITAAVIALALGTTGTSPSTASIQHSTGGEGRADDNDQTPTSDDVVSEYDGVVPKGVTPFNDEFPAVANLDPELLAAVRDAADDAADDGVTFYVNSGWRSPAYQLQLLREAVAEHGSIEEAARWVATPETSAHVSGEAVDIGPYDAAAWLGEHGAAYGLCPTYRNEPWHFELRRRAAEQGCPQMFADPTEDPRMRGV